MSISATFSIAIPHIPFPECFIGINRIYDGVEPETWKSQASFKII